MLDHIIDHQHAIKHAPMIAAGVLFLNRGYQVLYHKEPVIVEHEAAGNHF
jgi:hypothetical protein